MDKIEIFRDLTVKDLRNVDCDKFSTILGDYYPQFTNFCNFISDQFTDCPDLEGHIKGLECSIDDNGAVFSVGLDTGETKTIHFDKPGSMVNRGEGTITYKALTIDEIEDLETQKELEAAKNAASSSKRSRKKKE